RSQFERLPLPRDRFVDLGDRDARQGALMGAVEPNFAIEGAEIGAAIIEQISFPRPGAARPAAAVAPDRNRYSGSASRPLVPGRLGSGPARWSPAPGPASFAAPLSSVVPRIQC